MLELGDALLDFNAQAELIACLDRRGQPPDA